MQGAYLTLAPDAVRLEIELTVGASVAEAILARLDANADGTVSEDEAQTYAQGVLEQSVLTLDGVEIPWNLLAVDAPEPARLAAGHGIVRIVAVAERPAGAGTALDERKLTYQTGYEPAPSLWVANVFLEPGNDVAFAVTEQERSNDGRHLAVRYTESKR